MKQPARRLVSEVKPKKAPSAVLVKIKKIVVADGPRDIDQMHVPNTFKSIYHLVSHLISHHYAH